MANYTEGTTPQDQLMGFLVRKFDLNETDQLTVRRLLKDIENGSIQNYVDQIKPDLENKRIAKTQEQISSSKDLDIENHLNWAKEAQKAREFLEQQRNS